jgi:PAS domain S-box-containing protein/putative nucleotidyltransferase with HDIG domain
MMNATEEGDVYRAIFDASADAIILADAASGYLLDANPAAERLIGRPRSELIQMHQTELHPNDFPARQVFESHIQEQVDNPTNVPTEVVMLHADGRRIAAEVHSHLFEREGQKLILGVFRDLTARKDSEELFRTIMSTAQDAIVILNQDGVISYWNSTAQRIFGYSQEEAIGQFAHHLITPERFQSDALKGWGRFKHKGDGPVVDRTLELSARCRNGTELPIELSVSSVNIQGQWHAVGIARDISDRVKTEEKLRHKERGLAEAQRLAHIGNWELDIANNRLSWSDEVYRIFEIQHEDFHANYESFINVIHPDDRERVNRAYTESLANQTPYNITHRLLMPDGMVKYVHEICETRYDDAAKPLFSLGTVQDITEQHIAEQRLNQTNRALKTLSRGNKVLTHATKETSLLQEMCKVITDEALYRFAWIGYAEEDENRTLRPVAYAGYEEGYLERLNLTWADRERGRGPAGTAIRMGKAVIIKDVQTDPCFRPWREDACRRGYASVLSLPIMDGDKAFAGLNIYAGEAGAFDDAEVALLAELASDLSYGILSLRLRGERDRFQAAHIAMVERHKQALISTIRAISLTVEKRDPYTAGHQQRVADLAMKIGKELGLSEQRLEGLGLGALIHDIGKIYVPAELLNRPGRLSKAEFEVIQSHSEVGYDIIKDVEFPWPVADMVLQHHERLDGSGYPQGLKGEGIILEARILAVADAVEAITAHRPYRPALGIDIALEEMEKNRGRLYDPAVVDACLHLVRDQGFRFKEQDYFS